MRYDYRYNRNHKCHYILATGHSGEVDRLCRTIETQGSKDVPVYEKGDRYVTVVNVDKVLARIPPGQMEQAYGHGGVSVAHLQISREGRDIGLWEPDPQGFKREWGRKPPLNERKRLTKIETEKFRLRKYREFEKEHPNPTREQISDLIERWGKPRDEMPRLEPPGEPG